jgi:hypothetical protein
MGVILGLILLWAGTPQEYVASDPGAYARRAFNILQNGDFGSSHVFGHRIAVTLPVALLYALFGVNIHTTNLWPLIAVIILAVTVWLALPDKRSKCLGVVLCLLCVPLLDAAVVLLPDVIAAAFMGLSSLVLFKRRSVLQKTMGRSLAVPLAAVFLLFLAFLAKMSAYWLLPLWAMAIVADVRDNHTAPMLRRFYLPAVIAGLTLAAGYLLFCSVIWDDPFARFKSVQGLTGQHLWSWDSQNLSAMVRRLTVSPVRLLVAQYGTLIVLAGFGVILSPVGLRPWTVYTVLCILFFWFGSTSFTRYEPMPLVPRMTLPALPGILILAGYAASRVRLASERRPVVNDTIAVLLLLAIMALPFARHVESLRERPLAETRAMALVRQRVNDNADKQILLLCSDQRSPHSLSFYGGYAYPPNLRVAYPQQLDIGTSSFDEAFVFVHKQRSRFLQSAYGQRNFDKEIDALRLPIAYTAGDVVLFEAEHPENLVNSVLPNKSMEHDK